MRKDTAVAFSRIGKERRERYVTDGVRFRFYFQGIGAFRGLRAGLDELEAGLWIGGGPEGLADEDSGA
jgi:hypothetical protein